MVGLPDDPGDKPVDDLSHVTLLRTLLVLNAVILIGYALDEAVAETGVKLPLFVICLLVGIVATNIVPRLLPSDRMADANARRWRSSPICRSMCSWRCRS